MRICIDARFWGPSHTGLGVYTRELVTHLAKVDTKNEYILLVRGEAKDVISLPKNFSVVVCDAQAYTVKEQRLLPVTLHTVRPDLVHFPSINVPIFYTGKFVVTVHDLIKHVSIGTETTTRHPFIYWFKFAVYRSVFRFILGRATAILVPSRAVESELIKRYPFTQKKITVTHESFALTAKKEKVQLALPDTFAIYTGNAYPHKNLSRLVEAWEEVYQKTGTVLLISSGRSVFIDRIERLIVQHKAESYVRFCGYLSDEQLVTAYQKALVYVFPSLIEGFGIPGLDAMQYGLPVVCSRISVLEEIYGEAAEYFDPTNKDDIAEKVIAVIEDKKLREQLAKKGKEQVKKYSWEKTAKETLRIYEQINK